MARTRDGAPSRSPLPIMFRKPMIDIGRASRRIAKLSEDDRLNRNRSALSEMYLVEARAAHAQLTTFLAFLEKANAGR